MGTPVLSSGTFTMMVRDPADAERGYKNSQGFKIILPFPFTGTFPDYQEENVKDLRVYFNTLKENQGVASKKG